ncbi:MAG: magnesium-translocating P-type ATPase [Chloroflexi bacterium]|nr:magnesium-translocating P-type ATPase [Chloroflexota bacterium]MBP7045579.1 magnesium-translocating P-type ATPase [Chloroflexota bacterium]
MTELPDATKLYWSQPVDELLKQVASAPGGLATAVAADRLEQLGLNLLQIKAKSTPLGLFLNQFKSPIILILLFATVVSAGLKDFVDAIIILLIVLGSAILSFVQEYNASSATAKLQAQVSVKTTVLRDGQTQTIPAAEVVVGDVVQLSAGSLIPADGRILTARDCFVNQAVLTGETFPVEKQPGVVAANAALTDRTNCVFMGTNVRSGSATAVIVQTGAATTFGQIADRLTVRPPETEFERGIRHLGYLLTEVMLLLVLGIFAFNVFLHKPALDSLLFSLALAVGLTPQLLPAIININLSKGSQAMAKEGVIVRRLASIEDFGSMDILCTDKTGTLTLGVVQLDGAMDGDGRPSDDTFRAAYLNAHFQTGLSNPLDEAILAHATPDIAACQKLDEIPYDFKRKRLSVIVQDGERPSLITKGALNNVLAICANLSNDQRVAIDRQYTDWSGQGFRVLGVASKEVTAQPAYSLRDETDLTFSGFLLFLDPPKAGVAETIADLAALGVGLKIITGDNKLVAQHTAVTIGLEVKGVVTGADLDATSADALPQMVEQANLFAEVDPNQKESIILALQKMGHVVGYMGDGVNDAPSLHTADVGISVDDAVDVAKDAADFVLLRKDLSVLHQGIIQGRTTFANTLKYVFMATSANFGNMFSMAGASLLLPFLPMLPKQILLINFLTDLPEMTIANDRVDEVYVQQPHRWDIGFIRRFMLVFGPLSSLFDMATFGVLYWWLKADQATFHTGWFIESVLSASLVVFVLRTRAPFWRSRPARPLLVMTAVVGLIALALPYTPLATLLGFAPLPLTTLLILAAIVAAYFAAAEATKRWFYARLATS